MSSQEERNGINMDYALGVGARMIAAEVEGGKNVVYSPTSMTIALNMLALSSEGETLNDFLSFLGARDINQLCTRSQAIMSLLELCPATENTAPLIPAAPPQTEQLRTTKPSANSLPVRRKLFADPIPPVPTPMPVLPLENRPPLPVVFVEHAVWVDRPTRPLQPSFVAIAESIYKALVRNFDFHFQRKKVIAEANAWGKKATKGLFRIILPPSVTLEPLFVTTTTYFSSAWEVPFLACNSDPGDFHLLTGETIKVTYMTKTNEHFFFRSLQEFKFLRLPYRWNGSPVKGYSMFLFLPHTVDGVEDLLLQVGPELSGLRLNILGLEMERLSLVRVPKFTLAQTKEMRPRFAQGCSLFHTEFLRVNEEGSMTVESMEKGFNRAKGKEPMAVEGGAEFVADHPFLFTIIQDEPMLTVFVGAVLDPLKDCKELLG